MTTENKETSPTSEAPPPDWLNKDLIEKALRSDRDAKCHVKSISMRLATAPGDNFLSVIYRVKVELSDGTQQGLLVKTYPEGEALVAYLDTSKSFDKEGKMLGDVIPKMQALLEKGAPGRWRPMAARCPLYSPKFLVLEDLGPQGFLMANRLRGLGLRHCLLALRTLARFHASSHALLKKDPSLRERFGVSKTDPMFKLGEYISAGIQGAADSCREWPGFEEYSGRLERLKAIILDKIRGFYNLKPDTFAIISHGDFWVNNMMFCYDENGHPCDLRMVDLQISFVTSPILDLIHFLGTSPQESVSKNYQDLLIREYYFTLQDTLSALKIKAPTFEEFLAEMDAHGTYWLFGVLAVVPIIKSDEVADFDGAMAGDEKAMRVLYTRPLVKRWVQRVLPILKQKGYLDV